RPVDAVEIPTVIGAMDAVMQGAYAAASFRSRIELYAEIQPDGLVIALADGEVVGTGCCVAYPDSGFGWIGLVATAPSHARRGIARRVTDCLIHALRSHGCAAVLDASLMGAPLYEAMGFTDHGSTRALVVGDFISRATGRRASVVTNDDLDEIASYDRATFGANRRALLQILLGRHTGRAAVVRGSQGAIEGFVICQDDIIGPLAAESDAALRELVGFAMTRSWVKPPTVLAPPESRHLGTLRELGFQQSRELRHMRRGVDELPGARASCAGRVSLAVG
ncbi:MAG: N-acetyltransferase, partial [Acidimicrobiia bacterium]|nr:N-acetyltransferase [Acidimicrobiia bacterium]